jgi:hypothetical protein
MNLSKASSVPWRHFLAASTAYGKTMPLRPTGVNAGVNKLSGAQTVLAQLFDQGGPSHAQ